ncbi:MAG: PQQ-binding-like beta-propeller repeat protein [Verrucomicrobiota bacterium]
MRTPTISVCLSLILFGCDAFAEDWPQYRGSERTGISSEAVSVEKGTVREIWRTDLGLGYAGIVVHEGKVWTTGHGKKKEGEDLLFCFQADTGELLWDYAYPQALGDLYFQGGTTGSPSVYGERVYVMAREGEVICLEAETGTVVWEMNLMKDLGLAKPTWGFTGAPMLHQDLLLLTAGDGGVALNPETGAVIWNSGTAEAGYSTPHVFRREGDDLLLLSEKRGYVCVVPETGEEQWRHKWLTRYGVNAADPIVRGNEIFLSSGYGKGATLLRWDEGAAEPVTVWKNREMRNQMNPSVLVGDFLYGIDGNEGVDGTGLKCLEWSSGTTRWLQSDVGHGSVLGADGGKQLIVLSERGELMVGATSPDGFEAQLRHSILKGTCWTLPTLANGRIYARNAKGTLVCVVVE